jgi:hypothetical protein
MIIFKEFVLRKTGKKVLINLFVVPIATDMSDMNGRFTRLIIKDAESNCDYVDLSCNYDEFINSVAECLIYWQG